MTASSAQPADPSSCLHMFLWVANYFDTETPIACKDCGMRFEVDDAVMHVQPYIDAFEKADPPNLGRYPGITITYYRASHNQRRRTARDGSPIAAFGHAIPDLGIDMGHITQLDADVGLGELVRHALLGTTEQGKFPPLPRRAEELQLLFPKMAKWKWSMYGIDITDFLAELVA